MAAKVAEAGMLPFRDRPPFDSAWSFPVDKDDYPEAIRNEIRTMDWSHKALILYGLCKEEEN